MSIRGAALSIRTVWERIPTSVVDRGMGALLFFPGATVLALAAWLTPSPAGFGTHTQLGLGSCVMLSLTGLPCPMCGMTTTFAHMAHGHLWSALVNQPFGVALFVLTVLGTILGGADLASGRGLWRQVVAWVERREATIAVLLLAGMILGWIYKIVLLKGISL